MKRFRVAHSRKQDEVYKLRSEDVEITFRYPPARQQDGFEERLLWTWPAGGEYSLVVPLKSRTSAAYIGVDDNRICAGRGVEPSLRRALDQEKTVPIVEWAFEDQLTVICEGGALCCKRIPRTWALRHPTGRLAFWLARTGGYEGVLAHEPPWMQLAGSCWNGRCTTPPSLTTCSERALVQIQRGRRHARELPVSRGTMRPMLGGGS